MLALQIFSKPSLHATFSIIMAPAASLFTAFYFYYWPLLPATLRHLTFTIGHCCPPIHGFYYYYWPLLPAISRHLTLHAARHFTAIYFYCWFLVGVFGSRWAFPTRWSTGPHRHRRRKIAIRRFVNILILKFCNPSRSTQGEKRQAESAQFLEQEAKTIWIVIT